MRLTIIRDGATHSAPTTLTALAELSLALAGGGYNDRQVANALLLNRQLCNGEVVRIRGAVYQVQV